MKTWNQPTLEELDLSATAFTNTSGINADGSYSINDGRYDYFHINPSSVERPR